MLLSILYFVLAAFGLGFLVFIHELGHYFMARRVGMKIDAFGIGFGKPIFSWERNGVKWNICCLPFGGYVRIAGMEKEGVLEPHQIPDGFFGKPPSARVKVAIMGPLVNIVFALLLFAVIWASGGREKPFSELTHLIGWVDPRSELYDCGVRPGDEIQQYDGHPFTGFNDLLFASLLDGKKVQISGEKIDYEIGKRVPFQYTLDTYSDPRALSPQIRTIGIFTPARYLIYGRSPDGKESPLPEDSPMAESGIQYGDRIIWADGELIFSMVQLSNLLNEPKTLLTVQRGEKVFLTRIPRLKLSDLRLSELQKAEIDDWQHEAKLKSKLSQLYFIPYNLTHEAVVEHPFTYLDENSDEHIYVPVSRSPRELALEKGDRILAVDGQPVNHSAELLSHLQQRHVQLVVERKQTWPLISWKIADKDFDSSINWDDLQKIAMSIGTAALQTKAGNLQLLKPVTPKPLMEFPFYIEKKDAYAQEMNEHKKIIEEIEDPEERRQALQHLEDNQRRLMLGIVLQDLPVRYNPSPFSLFFGVFEQMWRTIKGLVTGTLSPKWMSGPVGIVQVFHYGWTVGVKEALFWMAVISLNLGLINLLPLPVLDGGHILFSAIESVTRKPIKAKTMEKLFIPFVILIVAAFVYFTYNDIVRLFTRF
jgi:regulator of sigma E protease